MNKEMIMAHAEKLDMGYFEMISDIEAFFCRKCEIKGCFIDKNPRCPLDEMTDEQLIEMYNREKNE